MSVGILTFHMAHNCGAMLQAYALSNVVTRRFHTSCQIIDYRLPDIYTKYENMLKAAHVEPRRLRYEEFLNKKLPLSERVYDIKAVKQYDLYLLGSDQIWNARITGGYKPEYFGEYFYKKGKVASYAASAGGSCQDSGELFVRLQHIRYISVRENELKTLLQKNGLKNVTCCLDPVFLLAEEDWSVLPADKPSLNRFILIYSFFVTDAEYEELNAFAHTHGIDAVEFITHAREPQPGYLYIDNYGPADFLAYIKNSTYVFTDSYHCALFSVIFGKPFYILRHGAEHDLRMADIIAQLGLIRDGQGFFRAGTTTSEKIRQLKDTSFCFLDNII